MAAKCPDELTGWDPTDPGIQADCPAELARLRASGDVAWCDRRGGFATLLSYYAVVVASRDPAQFTATQMTVIPSSPRKGLPRLPLQRDPPDSDRYRKGLNPFFKENRIQALDPALAALADRLFANRCPHRITPIVLVGTPIHSRRARWVFYWGELFDPTV